MGPRPEHTLKTLREAARPLTGPTRRRSQAPVTRDPRDGKARHAERVFGWGRQAVALGLQERRTGITRRDRFTDRGRPATGGDHPRGARDLREPVEPHARAGPESPSPSAYPRPASKAVRQARIDRTGDRDEDLACERTIGDPLNRLGDRPRHVPKARPLKEIQPTDATLAQVGGVHELAAASEDTPRIAIDTQAEVQVGGVLP